MNTYPIHENSRLGMPKAPCGSLSPCFAFLCVTYFVVTQSFTKQASSYTENNRHNCYNTFANQLPSISQQSFINLPTVQKGKILSIL